MRKTCHFLYRRQNFLFGKAALAGLAADVHLQQDLLRKALALRFPVDGSQKMERIHALDKVHLSHHLFYLIGLQVADEVDRLPGVGVFGQLGRQFLDPVLPAAVYPGGDGLPDGIGIVHFCGGAEEDVFGVPAAGKSSIVDSLPDGGNIFRNGHSRNLLSISWGPGKSPRQRGRRLFPQIPVDAAFKGRMGTSVDMACL